MRSTFIYALLAFIVSGFGTHRRKRNRWSNLKMKDSALKKRWVDALRSGKYSQGRVALRYFDDRYCCLGVLMDLVDPEGWSPTSWGTLYAHHNVANAPHKDMLSKATLNPGWIEHLVWLNDEEKKSFSEIADFIEENL